MKKSVYRLICFLLFSSLAMHSSMAETLYVTDRILLGMHQESNETSPIIKTIASGTPVIVVERSDNFTRIKLNDGTEGWISSNYLKKEKPATAELDAAYAKLQKEQENNKKLADELATKERETQVHRDELSNAKSTIKDLRAAMKEAGNAEPVVENTEELAKAQENIKTLEAKIAELEQEKQHVASQSGDDAVIELEKIQNQNKEFRVRIEAALANLKGETVPSAAELAAIRPSFPFWYWLLLIALFVLGSVGGMFWMDYMNRKKHGGFRL